MADNDRSSTRRRQFLKRAGASGLLASTALAGCTGNDGTGPDGGDGDDTTTTATTETTTAETTATTTKSVDEVKLGSVHPLSGFIAGTGKRINNAVKLAAKMKNDDGGIESLGGAEVTVLDRDHKAKQELASQAGKELVEEGVVGLLGTYFSPGAIALTQIAEANQVPFVTTVVGTDTLLKGKGLNYSYRPQPTTVDAARDYVEMVPKLVRDAGEQYESVGIFYVDNPFGQEIHSALKKFLPEKDVEVVEETAVKFGANSADTQATKLKRADPDAVVMATYEHGGRIFADSLVNLDYRPPFVNGVFEAAFVSDEVVGELPDVVNGATNNTSIADPRKDRTARVKERYSEEYGQKMDSNAVFGFIAADVLIQAIERAGTDDPVAINEAIGSITIEDHIGAMPPIDFRDDGENENSLAPVTQIQDRTVKVVHPEEFADAEMTF